MTPMFMDVSWMLAKLLIESTIPFFFKNYFSVTYLLSSPELSCLGVHVSWNQKHSTEFSISNGVQQGGVLSPILFTIYIDDLLAELEELGVGCYWNECTFSAKCSAPILNCPVTVLPNQGQLQTMRGCCISNTNLPTKLNLRSITKR